MGFRFENKKVLCTFLFCLASFLAGGLNGFLGTGGGIIFVLMLGFLTKNSPKDNFATSLCATIVLSVIGAYSYYKASNIDFDLIFRLDIFALLGGALGALCVDKLSVRWLNLIFAILIIYSGFKLLLR